MPDSAYATAPQKISVRLILLMALALAGLALSIALSQHFYQLRAGIAGFNSYCNLGSRVNCDVVAASSWAEILPGLPLSSIAAGWYLGMFFIFLVSIGFNVRRDAFRAAFMMTALSTLASLFYLYIMTARIGTFCILCLFLDGINLISLGIVATLQPQSQKSGASNPFAPTAISSSSWKSFSAIMALSLFVAVVGLKGLDTLADRGGDAQDHAQSILSRNPVALESSTSDLAIGPANAPITIVEFSDFQCPFCRIGAFTLHSVMSRYPKDVRVVMKPFPLDPACNHYVTHSMHPIACEAAKAAVCASFEGKFEPTYEAIFQNQESLAPGKPAEYAERSGANAAQLASCMSSNDALSRVQTTIEEGNRLNVQSTPTFFINGHRVEGVEPLPVWSLVIDELLKSPPSPSHANNAH